jgi:hypothetical protein
MACARSDCFDKENVSKRRTTVQVIFVFLENSKHNRIRASQRLYCIAAPRIIKTNIR